MNYFFTSLGPEACRPIILCIFNLYCIKKRLEGNKKEISTKAIKQKDIMSVMKDHLDFHIAVACKNPKVSFYFTLSWAYDLKYHQELS